MYKRLKTGFLSNWGWKVDESKIIKNEFGQIVSKSELVHYDLPEWYQNLVSQKISFKAFKQFGGPKYFTLADIDHISSTELRLTPYEGDDSTVANDPNVTQDETFGENALYGDYIIQALDLVSESTEYEPNGLLIWIPNLKLFGTCDPEHGDIYLYRNVTQQNFLKLVGYLVCGQWYFGNNEWHPGDFKIEHLYRCSPWENFEFVEDVKKIFFYNGYRPVRITAPSKVIKKEEPVLRVIRDKDGEWLFLHHENVDKNELMQVAPKHFVDDYIMLNEAWSLIPGWFMVRESVNDKWQRSRLP